MPHIYLKSKNSPRSDTVPRLILLYQIIKISPHILGTGPCETLNSMVEYSIHRSCTARISTVSRLISFYLSINCAGTVRIVTVPRSISFYLSIKNSLPRTGIGTVWIGTVSRLFTVPAGTVRIGTVPISISFYLTIKNSLPRTGNGTIQIGTIPRLFTVPSLLTVPRLISVYLSITISPHLIGTVPCEILKLIIDHSAHRIGTRPGITINKKLTITGCGGRDVI